MHGILMGFDEEVSFVEGLERLNVGVLIRVGLKLRVAMAVTGVVLCVVDQCSEVVIHC